MSLQREMKLVEITGARLDAGNCSGKLSVLGIVRIGDDWTEETYIDRRLIVARRRRSVTFAEFTANRLA